MSKWLAAWLLTAQLADCGTTAFAFARGLREANPLLPQNPAVICAIKSAWTGGALLIGQAAYRRHPRLTKWALITVGGITTSAVVWNVVQTRRYGR